MSALPAAPARFAFFDLDETVIGHKSLLACHAAYAPELADDARAWLKAGVKQALPRDVLNRHFYRRYLAGAPVQALAAAAARWRAGVADGRMYHGGALDAMARCRAAGWQPVLVTGSFREAVQPLARELDVAHVLCAPLEERGGCYTGRLTGAPMIGEGKRAAVAGFLRRHGTPSALCIGFGDDPSDLPFLLSLGRAYYCASGTAPAMLPAWAGEAGLAPLAAFQP